MRRISFSIHFPELEDLNFFKFLPPLWSTRGDYHGREVPHDLEVMKAVRIPFEKPLYQPEVDGVQTVEKAIDEWKREGIDCPIALVMPTNSFLAKILKPPPAELKKLDDIAKWEARQQIPFDLVDVEWRWLIGTGDQENGFLLDGELILAAVKKDRLIQDCRPFGQKEIKNKLDCVTFQTLTLLEYLAATGKLSSESALALVDMHAERTDLYVINNGSIWCRGISLGGAHMTRQLAKDLKLTFAKAEQLKLHAMESDDPKLVFQAMSPVFNDYVTEIQRSIGFYHSMSKEAKVSKIICMGNSSKMPGLAPYLGKNLGVEVSEMERDLQVGQSESVDSKEFDREFSNFVHPMMAAVQRLGYGLYRENFVPNGKPFGVKAKMAWGIEIGSHGLTAVKVRRALK